MMNYKGYIAEVEYDDDNEVFSGYVINTRTVITFHGSSVNELRHEFEASINDYLDWCKEDGIDPEKPFSGKFNVRISPTLHKKSAVTAKKMGLSLNKLVEQSIEKFVSNVI